LTTPEAPAVPNPRDEAFFAGTYRRLMRSIIVLFLLGAPALWSRYGSSVGLGFVIGGPISIFNFLLLKKAVTALLDRVTQSGEKHSSGGVVFQFLLRYFLIGLATYVIFKGSAVSVIGLMVGLSLPVGAVLIEAIYASIRLLRQE
jgi:hypothetical protein